MNALHKAFDARWIPEPNSGCWLWTGNYTKLRGGYGLFTMRPLGIRMRYAHRLSWELHRGPIPPGMHILHKCDTPSCVNPDHLCLGTNDDNMMDMRNKKRHMHGSSHWNTKLTEAEVIAIRADTRRHKQIAADYNIHPGSVGDIKRRKSWYHI